MSGRCQRHLLREALVGDSKPDTDRYWRLEPAGPTDGNSRAPRDDEAPRRTVGTVQLVDHTGTAHLVTIDEAMAGVARTRYITLCGGDVLPAPS